MTLGTIVTLLGLFKNNSNDNDDWHMSAPEFLFVFLAMRLVQYLLGLAMARDKKTSKGFICATNFLLFVIYWVCGSVVYWTAEG